MPAKKKATKKYTKSHIKPKIRKVFDLVHNENKDVAVAMREVGYADSSAKNPHLLTRSDSWLALLDSYGLTDEKIAKTHRKLLESDKEDIRLRATDLAYKVRGKYDKENANSGITNAIQIVINPIPPEK